ncbi:hypothetical protein AGOR_G00111990 [Albula goreensis]|uniref:Uncharacterized protein n=1 Tax=Albula goreensis TaxID=1534307 RepID=A0A8T3DNZ0_9TELE|nr:hypothetical protein AGOR_G00111990 [Albula goreensis]
MDTKLDNFTTEKLFLHPHLLDLDDLNDTDFLTNVHFSEHMEDLSSELFSSLFENHLLTENTPLLALEGYPPSPDIQAEHSYSLSGDSTPQSPSLPVRMDEETESEGMWSFGQDLTSILVKQELCLLSDTPLSPQPAPGLANNNSHPLSLALPTQRSITDDEPQC